MPLNLPSHAHGEGYADMNTVIPEFVERVNFEKGPYYADVGNFGAAGSAHLEFSKTLPLNFIKLEGGMYGYGRSVFGVSRNVGAGNLLYGGEVYHDNGPWSTHEDNYYKYNGLATYSQGEGADGVSVTARAYRGTWHSSDQIPVRAVPLVGYFGTLDPDRWRREPALQPAGRMASSGRKIRDQNRGLWLLLRSEFVLRLHVLSR